MTLKIAPPPTKCPGCLDLLYVKALQYGPNFMVPCSACRPHEYAEYAREKTDEIPISELVEQGNGEIHAFDFESESIDTITMRKLERYASHLVDQQRLLQVLLKRMPEIDNAD